MIKSIAEAEIYLQHFVSQNKKLKFPGDLGLQRTKYFLSLLKNPQNKVKVIHIAGTSGKGSTAMYASFVLESLDFKVGLHISPYFIDFRERFQINNKLISEKKFCKYLNEIIPAIEKVKKSKFGEPSYFEILTVLAFYIFQKEKADYAIMETGLGGLFDATNVVDNKNKLCLLSKIGHDHTRILGKTLDKIAFQKAGIIQKENKVLSVWQPAQVRRIFERQVLKKKGALTFIKENLNFKNIVLKNKQLSFNFNFEKCSLKDICLETRAAYQAENCALALAAVNFLSQRDKFLFNDVKIKKTLKTKKIIGRMENMNLKKKALILDGAHNPQKMQAFIKSLRKAHPLAELSFLVAFKKGKDYKKILSYITPEARDIILTDFKITNQDWLHISENPEKIAKSLKKLNFLKYEIIHDAELAFKKLMKKTSGILVITGSIYLLGRLYPLLKEKNKN